MTVFSCSTCKHLVPESSLRSGTAVWAENGKVHCFQCISSRAANLPEDVVYRARLAKINEGGLRQVVRRFSRRILTNAPVGALKRIVRRMSDRIFRPKTHQHNPVPGSSPRNTLPAKTVGVVAAVTKQRTEAQNLALACVACVIIAIGTLALYMGFGRKNSRGAEAPDRLPAAALNAGLGQADSPPAAVAVKSPTTPPPPAALVHAAVPAASPLADARGSASEPRLDSAPTVIPPLLIERDGGLVSTRDFRAQLAQDQLEAARDYNCAQPADVTLYQRKLSDIVKSYRGTAAADEAARLLTVASTPAPAAEPKPAVALGWLAAWQVENLEKRARVRMFEEFDGHKAVLETYPPDPAQPLRLTRRLKVPEDAPLMDLTVRGSLQGNVELLVEAAGRTASAGIVRGAGWRSFILDFSDKKGSDVTVTLQHGGADDRSAPVYWDAPEFVSLPSSDATPLTWGVAAPKAAPGSAFDLLSKTVNLLALIQPHRDAISGIWTTRDGALVSDRTLSARLEIPYEPPQEYDFRMRFTRQEGTEGVAQILSHSDRSFCWVMGDAGNTTCGFETVAGQPAVINATAVKQPRILENGRTYTALVQVRKKGATAFLDGKQLCQYKTDYSDLDLPRDWSSRTLGALGIGSSGSPTIFHSLEVVEVTGRGRVLATEPATVRPYDPKLEYEVAAFEIYGQLASKGAATALERIGQAHTNPLLAPLRAKLDRDEECITALKNMRPAALAGAARLINTAGPFTFVLNDRKEIRTGAGTGAAVTDVSGTLFTIEQTSGTTKATMRVSYKDLSPATQCELVRLGAPMPVLADLLLGAVKLARFSAGGNEFLIKQVRAHLDAARTEPALAANAEHLLNHLTFFQRDYEAQTRFEAIETLCRQEQWREARTAIDEFRKEHINSYALERVNTALERLRVRAERETVSPITKR